MGWHAGGANEHTADMAMERGGGAGWGYMVFELHGAGWSAHQIAGVAITIVAYCFWALARLQLGRSFAIRPEARKLVTQGLYAKIQNPVYVFGAIFIVGMLVFFGHPVWFLFFLILIPMQWMRIRKERLLLERNSAMPIVNIASAPGSRSNRAEMALNKQLAGKFRDAQPRKALPHRKR